MKKLPKGKGLLAGLSFNLEAGAETDKMLKGIPPSSGITNLEKWRQQVAAFGRQAAAVKTQFDTQVRISDKYIAVKKEKSQIRLRIYQPINGGSLRPLLLWMHGGGMIGGTPEQDEVQMKEIVAGTGAVVVSVDYRTAPEYPYPIPVQDCYDALLWAVHEAAALGIDINKLAVGGASAGGGLAASLALLAKKKNGPGIIHQSLTYPMLDNRNRTSSSYQITDLGLWDRKHNLYAWDAYLGKKMGRKKVPGLAVPAREKDLAGLPSAFIAVGALDLFRDEDLEYALRLMEAGVHTELHYYAGAVHGFDWHVPAAAITADLLQKRMQALQQAFR